jgi:hypothetical protein
LLTDPYSHEQGKAQTGPAAEADIDGDQKNAYERVISESHSTIPEHLAGQSRTFGEAADTADD